MSSFIKQALGVLLSARYFLPAVAFGAIGIYLDHPSVLALLLGVQPLFAAAATRALGYELEESLLTLVLRRGSVLLGWLLVFAILVAFAVGWPLMQLLAKGGLTYAMVLSVGFLLCLFALVPFWPVFGLALLWDDAYPDHVGVSWMGTAWVRITAFARHLTNGPHPLSGAWLTVAFAQSVLAAGALLLAGIGDVLPSEFRTLGLWVYLLALSPLAHLLTLWCVERLLIGEEDELEEAAVAPEVPEERLAPSLDLSRLDDLIPDSGSRNAALLNAAAQGEIDLALRLLREGADPNSEPGPIDKDQRTALMCAALNPDLRLLRELIARGADVNRQQHGLSALLLACRDSVAGRAEAVITLLANGANVRQHDTEGHSALHYAAHTTDPTVAAALLDSGADLEWVNRDGYTPLAVAARAGNEAIVKLLLERGARADPERGVPALIAAASAQEDVAPIIKRLLKSRARVDARDRLGRTALHAAALHGHGEICELLLANGIEIDARDSHGVTALMEASRSGANRVLTRMVFRKPNASFIDAVGRTALHLACQSRQSTLETVQSLLTMGVSTELKTKDGKRAVDFAAQLGRYDFVALIDPEYPLPNAIRESQNLPAVLPDQEAHAEERLRLLHEALRTGRLIVARELLGIQPALDTATLLQIASTPLAIDSASALECLLAAGLPLEWQGQSLLELALSQEPPALCVADHLLDRAAPAGGPLLASLLAHASAEAQSLERVESLALRLLTAGSDPFVSRGGRTALHWACALDLGELALQLLARGIDPNCRDQQGDSPLCLLGPRHGLTLAQALLVLGANPEQSSRDGQTPLGRALVQKQADLAYLLNWPDWPLPGRPLRDADLVDAAKVGDLESVSKLLDLGLHIDARDQQGCSALLRAAGGGHQALLELLLARGADAGLPAHNFATPLSAAIVARRDRATERLLEHGVNINQPAQDGLTPLMLAAAMGATDLVDRLLAAGADANLQDRFGNTALHAVAMLAWDAYEAEPARSLFTRLLDRGCPINERNHDGQNALLVLLGARTQAGQPVPNRQMLSLVEALIARGADLDCQDRRGVSVLHAAAMHGSIELIDRLLQAGADLRRRDTLGRSAYDVAVLLGLIDVAQRLKRD